MILAIEAASPVTKLWLGAKPAQSSPDVVWESGRELADGLLIKIDELLKASDAKLSDLTGIIVFSGPGSFTSLRIGHTVASTLADALKIPVVGGLDTNWLQLGIIALPKAKLGQPVLPFYGSEANITKPKA